MSRLRKVRREIAQLETVLHMRSLAVAAALQQPEVGSALESIEWRADAHYSYEDSAWKVAFLDSKDKQITSSTVQLNKKKAKGSSRRRAANQ
jgi:hypothetical protein